MKLNSIIYLCGTFVILGLAAISCESGVLPRTEPVEPVARIVPPSIPHSLDGRSDCLICHEKGIGGAPQYPENHVGRTSDVCTTCHIKAPFKNASGTITPVPSATTPAENTPTPVPPVTTPAESTPTTVSAADLFGKNCAACHGPNRQGVPGFAPALTSDSMLKFTDAQINDIITNGRPGTAMPAYKDKLNTDEIDRLVQLLKSD